MLRIVQWTTGRTGRAAVRAVLEHPELQLVRCFAWSADKVGVDVGELCRIEPTGILATDDVATLLEPRPDCVVYTPYRPCRQHGAAVGQRHPRGLRRAVRHRQRRRAPRRPRPTHRPMIGPTRSPVILRRGVGAHDGRSEKVTGPCWLTWPSSPSSIPASAATSNTAATSLWRKWPATRASVVVEPITSTRLIA